MLLLKAIYKALHVSPERTCPSTKLLAKSSCLHQLIPAETPCCLCGGKGQKDSGGTHCVLGGSSSIGTSSRRVRTPMYLSALSQRKQEAREVKWHIQGQLLHSQSIWVPDTGFYGTAWVRTIYPGKYSEDFTQSQFGPTGATQMQSVCAYECFDSSFSNTGVTLFLLASVTKDRAGLWPFAGKILIGIFKDRDVGIFLSCVHFLALDHPRLHIPRENACSFHTRSINCSDCGPAMICSWC